MREIKFRAWDRATKLMFVIFDNEGENWFLPKWKSNYEVMEFTGLLDEEGKEIYEGDLAENDGRIYQVVWMPNHAKWGVKVIKTTHVLSKNMTFPIWQYVHEGTSTTNFKVIGNIHETQEAN